jgi:ATP-dependent Lon protease
MDSKTAQPVATAPLPNTQANIIANLKQKLQTAQLPHDVGEKLQDELSRIELFIKANQYGPQIDSEVNYVNLVCDLPWAKTGQDILDLARAKQVLDKNHHGMEVIKDRILEYLSVLILNHKRNTVAHQPVLAFVGLVGSGKTSIAYSIAEALGRPLIRIPFGGLGSALQLRGESRIKPEAEAGLIIKALKKAKVDNPVILLDELDRVTQEARNDIMGVLVELLDPEQNMAFLDHYVGFPFDLSKVLFIATANNTGNISTAVLDRLELIEMPFYSDEQKVVIGRDYLLPEALKNSGIDPSLLQIDSAVWPAVVRPLGFDGGIRSLKRNIDSLVRKVARKIVAGESIPGMAGKPVVYQINASNLNEYLPTAQ